LEEPVDEGLFQSNEFPIRGRSNAVKVLLSSEDRQNSSLQESMESHISGSILKSDKTMQSYISSFNNSSGHSSGLRISIIKKKKTHNQKDDWVLPNI
jgi:hypothetical protein